jgi:hypothetical protein
VFQILSEFAYRNFSELETFAIEDIYEYFSEPFPHLGKDQLFRFLRRSPLFTRMGFSGTLETQEDSQISFSFLPSFRIFFSALHIVSFVINKKFENFFAFGPANKLKTILAPVFIIVAVILSEINSGNFRSSEILVQERLDRSASGIGISLFLELLISEPRDNLFLYEPGLWAVCLEVLLPEPPETIGDFPACPEFFCPLLSELERIFWVLYDAKPGIQNNFETLMKVLTACPKVYAQYDFPSLPLPLLLLLFLPNQVE